MIGSSHMKLFGLNTTSQKTTFRRKRFPFAYLVFAILSGTGLGLMIYALPPTTQYSLLSIPLSILLLFFPLVFCFFFFTIAAIFRSRLHGALVASFVTLYLLFRISSLTHPFFFILLAALFLAIELMLANRRN